MTGTIGIIVQNSSDSRARVLTKFINMQFPRMRVGTINLHVMVPDYWKRKKNTKASYEPSEKGAEFLAKLEARLASKYDAFICIDVAFAHYTLGFEAMKGMNDTDKLSGMLATFGGKPVLFHFDPTHLYGRMHDEEHHAVYGLLSSFHIKKLVNKLAGIESLERPYELMIPSSMEDLAICEEIAAQSDLIAFDIENSGGFISCVGFACLHPCGKTMIFVIPLFINLDDSDGMYWNSTSAFYRACDTITNVLGNAVPKVAHNGAYDITHLFRANMVPNNYIFDTMAMIHATWPTIPRSLYVGSSMFVPGYRYWKDDAKDVGEDGKVKWQVPKTPEKTMAYWKYNGLDCANTLELCLGILRMWQGQCPEQYPQSTAGFDHVWHTYVREFALEFGPCLYMSMSGLRCDPMRQFQMREQLRADALEAEERLRILIGDQDFNANSPAQVGQLIYDVLDIKPLARKGRVTDKRILQKFADLHPIYRDVIESVWAVKEPRNNASKYGDLPLWKDRRMLYQVKACNTATRRLASAKHNFGYGSNFQNIPKSMRPLFHADDGEILCCTDYSQSDSYFVAFESQDPAMMETVTDDRDTHSVHVEFFFGHKYEDVVAGDKAKAPWVVDPVTGVRQIIKKVSHGTNYDMGGDTMLLNVRREAAIAMVNALLNSPNAKLFMRYMTLDESRGAMAYVGQGALWSDKQLAKACEFAQRLYYARYPRLAKWKKDAVAQATANSGIITMFGGSTTTMLCRPVNNPRFVPAAYGQGGTSGNINNAMLRLFLLADHMWKRGFRMVLQVHDELVCAIPENAIDLVADKVAIMETPCTIHGRTFTIPVAAELSKSWDPKNTVDWEGLDEERTSAWYREQIAAKEKETLSKLGLT